MNLALRPIPPCAARDPSASMRTLPARSAAWFNRVSEKRSPSAHSSCCELYQTLGRRRLKSPGYANATAPEFFTTKHAKTIKTDKPRGDVFRNTA